jgi:hypothetical protein
MKSEERPASNVVVIAAIIFAGIAFCVLIAFEPTREMFCGRYEPRGLIKFVEPLASGDPSCFRNFIYDYQTLLTGILAIVAAVITVSVAVKTEKMAQWRHAQLVRLQMRPDKLTLERGILPQAPVLRSSHKTIQDCRGFFVVLRREDAASARRMISSSSEIGMVVQAMQNLREAFADETWMAAETLFDGRLMLKRQFLTRSMPSFSIAVNLVRSTQRRSRTQRMLYRGSRLTGGVASDENKAKPHGDDWEILKIPDRFLSVATRLDDFMDELQRLSELYEIDLGTGFFHLTPSPDQS